MAESKCPRWFHVVGTDARLSNPPSSSLPGGWQGSMEEYYNALGKLSLTMQRWVTLGTKWRSFPSLSCLVLLPLPPVSPFNHGMSKLRPSSKPQPSDSFSDHPQLDISSLSLTTFALASAALLNYDSILIGLLVGISVFSSMFHWWILSTQ